MPVFSAIDISISSKEVNLASRYLREVRLFSPMVMYEESHGGTTLTLKLENLLPTGSFKIRAAAWALQQYRQNIGADGVWTASAGNMGRALARQAQQMGIPCAVLVPDDAPQVKLEAIRSYGARVVEVSFEEYQQTQINGWHSSMKGKLVHPFADKAVVTANAVIGLEILGQQPEVEAIFIPYGGGGLTCGIAQAVKAKNPRVKIIACEVETAAPLTACLRAGKLVNVSFQPSFISGMGAPFVFPQMWQWVSKLVDDTCVVSLEEVAAAMKLLAVHQHILVEGAGAVSLAAALRYPTRFHQATCIISGGNVDLDVFRRALDGTLSE